MCKFPKYHLYIFFLVCKFGESDNQKGPHCPVRYDQYILHIGESVKKKMGRYIPVTLIFTTD